MDSNERSDDGVMGGAIRTLATRYRPAPTLSTKIVASLAAETAAEPPRISVNWRRWGWLRLGATFASGLLVGLSALLINPMPADDPMAREVVASHVRSLMVEHLSDVVSTDQHKVKPWFNGKLDFSPPVEDLTASGFPLAGGRLDYVNQRAVAALIYHRRQHTINVFIWPERQLVEKPTKLTRQGYNLESWREGGMQFWAVSDLNAQELSEFARLLGAGS